MNHSAVLFIYNLRYCYYVLNLYSSIQCCSVHCYQLSMCVADRMTDTIFPSQVIVVLAPSYLFGKTVFL